MQPEPYDDLAQALSAVGLTGQRSRADQLIVCAQQGPVWQNRGNSFWLSQNEGVWYLSTWLPVCYRVPSNQDIVRLCVACVAVGTSAISRVPPDIVARFELQEIDDRQYERLFPTEGEND